MRADEPDRAAELVERLRTKVTDLRLGLAEPLRRLDRWAERRSSELAQELRVLARQIRQRST